MENTKKKEKMKKRRLWIKDQRVCLYYINNRIKNILADSKTYPKLKHNLEGFQHECVYNIEFCAVRDKKISDI